MLFLDGKKALAERLGLDYSQIAYNDQFSEEDLERYLNDSGREAWDFRFWDDAEAAKTGTLSQTDIDNGFVAYPSDFVPGSLYLFEIDGTEQDKRRFQDFRRYFKRNASGTDTIWAEQKRRIFFNVNNVSVGTSIDLFGKKAYVKLTDDADLMPFGDAAAADQEQSGNTAIITLAYSYALASDKKKNPSQAAVERQKAYDTLNVMWSQQVSGQAAEQPTNRPMFVVPDYYAGRGGGRSYNIGRFGQD